MTQNAFHSPFVSIRKRLVIIRGASLVCWTLLVVMAVLLAGAWFDLIWELTPQARLVTVRVALIAGVALLILGCVRCISEAQASDLAKQLDKAGQTGGLILSGWELSRDMLEPVLEIAAPAGSSSASTSSSSVPNPLRASLAQLAVAQASEAANAIQPSDVVTAQPLRRASYVLAGFFGVVGLLVVAFPLLAKTQWERFVNPYADHPPYSALQFLVEPGDAEVIFGDRFDVVAKVKGDTGDAVENLALVYNVGGIPTTVQMFAEQNGRWRATLALVTESTEYFVRADRARSERYTIRVITTPKISAVEFRVEPPAYTRMPIYTGPLPDEGLSGLPGTMVSATVTSNRPLTGGVLAFNWNSPLDDMAATTERATTAADPQPAIGDSTTARSKLEMETTSRNPHQVAVRFPINANGRFQLSITDVDQQSSRESFGGSIVLLEDESPLVRIADPKQVSLATPSAELPITILAEDDYGVASLQLFRSLNRSRPRALDIPIDTPPSRRIRHRQYLPLGDYGLMPGDELRFFARAVDNDPLVASGKGAESAVVTVQIVSQEDFERMAHVQRGLEVLMSKYQQAHRRLEKMQQEILGLQELAKEVDSPQLREKLQQLAKRMQMESTAIRQAAQHPLPFDIDTSLTEVLEKLADQIEKASHELQKPISDDDLLAALDLVALELQQSVGEFHASVLQPLQLLAQAYPLIQDQYRFIALAGRQRNLATRMEPFKGVDGNANPKTRRRMRELQDEQHQLMDDLDGLLNDIQDHAKLLPDDDQFGTLRETAMKFVVDVRESGAADEMSDAEFSLSERGGTQAWVHADEAANILASFIKRCQGTAQASSASCLAFSPVLAECLGNSIQQLLIQAGLGMGLGSGNGLGIGSGGGYSAQRGGMNQIGLYGSLPGMGPQASGEFGESQSDATTGMGFGEGDSRSRENVLTNDTTGAATGSGGRTVPLQYRKRVGQYMRRLMEETQEPAIRRTHP